MPLTIWTIGHSTRPIEDFIALLRAHGIRTLADVRTVPRSRRVPQFNQEALIASLADAGIRYIHLKDLGGLRKPRKDSPNTAWRNEQFRAYADHMATEEFRTAVDALLASPKRTCVMCAEAVPWRCHRNLLADELTRRGIEVIHILGPRSLQRHVLNAHARLERDRVVYPDSDQGSLL